MIDSHAHLGDPSFDEDREEVFARAQEAGLTHIINICTDAETLEKGLTFPSWVYNTAATTPHDVEGDTFFPLVEKHVDRLIAIGETGLDYFYEHAPRDLQKDFLRRYLKLAKKHSLPVVIHCREAFPDFFRILDEEYPEGRAVLHCFTGTLEEARQCTERGMMVSFSGIITFKKSEELREVAKKISLDHILIETDAPYLAPPPHRGKRNEPAYVKQVAITIAEVKGIPVEDVIETTKENTLNLFNLYG